MKKLIVLLLALISFIPIVHAEEFNLSGKYAVLYNLNENKVLYEQDKDLKTPIASLTKIMTSIVAIENIEDVNATVTITNQDFQGTTGYSKAGFQVGDQVTYLDLLYGALLPSGAEAVNALVNNTLQDKFIEEMNNTAKRIGLTSTSFSNPVGKDEDANYSTASDVAKLLNYALKNETFRQVFTTKTYTTTNNKTLKSTLLLYGKNLDISKIAGAKSGFTGNAGRCLASISTINNVNYLFVVIGADVDTPSSAVGDTLTIYDYYGTNYSYQTILDKTNKIKTIPVKWSKEKEYEIYIDETKEMYLKNNTSANLKYVYEGIEEIPIHTKKNTKLGTVKVYAGDELLYETTALLLKDIDYYHPLLWGISALILLIIITLIIIIKRKKKRKRATRKSSK